MTLKVAVVGGGVFGCVAAVDLAAAGNSVTLFEREETLLTGSSSINTGRVHLGYHYPRDFETARQSKIGSAGFLTRFESAIRNNFQNYYGIPRTGSKTSRENFEEFTSLLDLPLEAVEPPPHLVEMGLDPSGLQGFWAAGEAVFDVTEFKHTILQELFREGVAITYGSEVSGLENLSNGLWRVCWASGFDDFDVIVLATYGTDAFARRIRKGQVEERKYQTTLTLEVGGLPSVVGLTLIDGDFFTVLPKGFGGKHLIYAPKPSVLRSTWAESMPENFSSVSPEEVHEATEEILGMVRSWLPLMPRNLQVRSMVGTRTLLKGVESTDARPSFVTELEKNCFEIWSGKLDHSCAVSSELVAALSSR